MAYYNELANVLDVRSTYLAIVGTGDDTLMRDVIRGVSAEIEQIAHRNFVPKIETRYFDYLRDVDGASFWLDADLLAVTTLTNGDGNTIASNKYVFEPRNRTPYFGLRLLTSGGVWWAYNQDTENAVSINGVWGYHTDYTNAWQSVDTLGANTTDTATSLTTTGSALLKAGNLVKIDSEYLYVSAVSTTTATVTRGVNGSTAAAHSNTASISVWMPDASLVQLAKETAAARYRLRENPLAETIVIDGNSFATPKDVTKYITTRLQDLGMVRNTL